MAGHADATPVIEIEGEAADWSRRSVVLGEVPDRIPCVLPLPDHRSVRFVWGRPARAEDIDTSTGRRSPSPVVPAAYAEGCPDLSPDGQRLLYLGHVADGRAFAFVADNPEGRDAVPTVATAEPTYRSEPRWRPDGKAFFYEADVSHTGLYSLVAKRSTIIPLWEGTERSGALAPLRWMASDRLFAVLGHKTATEIIGVNLTSLEPEVHLQLSGMVIDLQTASTDRYWAVSGSVSQNDSIFGVDLRARRARRLGTIPGEMLRGIVPVENGLFFWSRRDTDFMVLREGGVERSVKVGSVLLGTVARCGARLLTSESDGRSARIAERKETGELVRYLTEGPLDRSVSCGPTGRWYYVRFVDPAYELIQCDGSHCAPLTRRHVVKAQVSPDGTKIALVLMEPTGPAAAWIDIETPEQVHMVGQIETICSPVWSSVATVWFSRRRGEVVEWIETDLSSGRTTGSPAPGHDRLYLRHRRPRGAG